MFPKNIFEFQFYIPLLDNFIQQLNERFNNKKDLIASLQNVIPKFCVNKKYEDIKPCVDFYIGYSNSLAIRYGRQNGPRFRTKIDHQMFLTRCPSAI